MRGKFYYLQKQALKMLTLAIYHGDLIPSDCCEKCGVSATARQLDGHHEDYSKPLEVIWLCRNCHKLEHNRDGEFSEKRPSPKMQKAIAWILEHPEHMGTESRILGGLIGVSHTLANSAKKAIKARKNGNHEER